MFEAENEWGIKVSNCFYDFENMEKIEDVQEEYKKIRENLGINAIKAALVDSICCYKCFGGLLEVTSAWFLVYGAIINFQQPLTDFQSSILQIYLGS